MCTGIIIVFDETVQPEIFTGKKLSRIGENIEFRGENFRCLPIRTVGWALLRGKFADKTFAEGGNTTKFTKVFT